MITGNLLKYPQTFSGMTVAADKILVRGLSVDAFVGVHDFEHDKRQNLSIDIEITTVSDYARLVRETGRYISYGDAVKFVRDIAGSDRHIELVETWAEEIADFVLQNELVASVAVTVLKTEIFAEAAGVGITIERQSQ